MPVLSFQVSLMLLKLHMYLHFTHSLYPEFPVQEEECSKIGACLNLFLRGPWSVQCPVNLIFNAYAAFVSQHRKPHLLSDTYFFPLTPKWGLMCSPHFAQGKIKYTSLPLSSHRIISFSQQGFSRKGYWKLWVIWVMGTNLPSPSALVLLCLLQDVN